VVNENRNQVVNASGLSTISTKNKNRGVLLSIEDSGEGMNQQTLWSRPLILFSLQKMLEREPD
jgi:hypothetical protein